MIKLRLTLIELLGIIGVVAITGSLTTSLFFGFIKESKNLSSIQQKQKDFKLIIRTAREWAKSAGPEIHETNGTILSKSCDIVKENRKVYFKIVDRIISHEIPEGYQITFLVKTNDRAQNMLILNAQKKELRYNLKLLLGEAK